MDPRVVRSVACVVFTLSVGGCARVAASVVTQDEFAKLTTGMTLEQVQDVVGAAPVEAGKAQRSDGKLEERFGWTNADGSSAGIVLLDGKLVEKSSEGLE
ncbi:MAG: hypothetical protein C0418_00550 [Coriobacteriaceae bacterium]|nr:hypothetical protein [Coriobacteriaceae bacterium]